MKPLLLVLIPITPTTRERAAALCSLVEAPDDAARAAAVQAHGAQIRVVLTNGTVGFGTAEIDACPALDLICVLGAGHENVASEQALRRGIAVTTGTGANEDSVADHAMALLLATVRAIPQQDRACRAGVWRTELPVQPQMAGKKLGLLGLGAIGMKIARRAAGFDMEIGYHTRSVKNGTGYRYFDSPVALASWCDMLVVATPGGAATQHLVDAEVLDALGPEGYLVNIARGSVVDTEALAWALRDKRVKGAGLDVYESEPAPPAALLGFDSVVLTPHVGGASPEAIGATHSRFLENLRRHLAGEPLLFRLPG